MSSQVKDETALAPTAGTVALGGDLIVEGTEGSCFGLDSG
jgi:hypothetical protein